MYINENKESADNKMSNNGTQGVTNEVDENYVKSEKGILFDNSISFEYNNASTLTHEDFKNISTMTDLHNKFPIFSVRNNNEQYYTIYNGNGNTLYYVIFMYSPNTGVNFFLEDVIEYTLNDNQDKLNFVLEKDMPSNILPEVRKND
jgi:hypothetical protein